jgi:saccharopine dehydrogenase-like NADP-dependent oxidoreductase
MKVCIIGCGNQGGCLAALLAMERDIDQIILADMDIKKAETVRDLILALGDRLNARDIRVDTVNAMDAKDIARVASGSKLVFNGILPFCNLPVMKGALAAKANYMDLYAMSADVPGTPWEETIEAQMELDAEFKAVGLTALPAEGVSPGWVNLVTKYITDQMDTVEAVTIRSITWMEGKDILAIGPQELSIQMSLRLEPSSYYHNGKIVMLDALDAGEEYEFPAPAGKKRIYMESVSCVESMIQKYSGKPIGQILHRGAILGGTSDVKDLIFRAVRDQVLKHPGTEEMNLIKLLASSLKPLANTDFKKALESGDLTDGADTAAVEVVGKKDGQDIRHTASFISTVHEAVKHLSWVGSGAYGTVGSTPLILALMLLRGEMTQAGVVLASQLAEPEKIFKKIAERGHILSDKIERSTTLLPVKKPTLFRRKL